MDGSFQQNPPYRPEYANPENYCHLAKAGNTTVKQENQKQPQQYACKARWIDNDLKSLFCPNGNKNALIAIKILKYRAQNCRELGHGDQARGQFQRPAQQELPDEEKGEKPAPPFLAEAFEQVTVRASRAGKHRGQFAPDQAVHKHEQAGSQPAQKSIRPRQFAQQERNVYKNACPDHHGYI